MDALFLTPVQKKRLDQRELVEEARRLRIEGLIARFNGAIKYLPLVTDHPELSDDEMVAFARHWHAKAMAQLRAKVAAGGALDGWNNGIPYGRNIPTAAMLKEAGHG